MTALSHPESTLPPIPNKRYFTIGEVGTLCDVKSHVLRYWEQEFTQLKPTKRRGNRRYYQRHDIELIRLIRSLLYEQGFTIAGARQQLVQVLKQSSAKPTQEVEHDLLSALEPLAEPSEPALDQLMADEQDVDEDDGEEFPSAASLDAASDTPPLVQIRQALEQISRTLDPYL